MVRCELSPRFAPTGREVSFSNLQCAPPTRQGRAGQVGLNSSDDSQQPTFLHVHLVISYTQLDTANATSDSSGELPSIVLS